MSTLYSGLQKGLFVFGTLCDRDVLRVVAEIELEDSSIKPCIAINTTVMMAKSDHYPVLISRERAFSTGLLIENMSQSAFDRILFYEGNIFSIHSILVRIIGCFKPLEASYFAHKDPQIVGEKNWTLPMWQTEMKEDILPKIERYMNAYGKMSSTEADVYW